MNLSELRISRRSVALAAAVAGMVQENCGGAVLPLELLHPHLDHNPLFGFSFVGAGRERRQIIED